MSNGAGLTHPLATTLQSTTSSTTHSTSNARLAPPVLSHDPLSQSSNYSRLHLAPATRQTIVTTTTTETVHFAPILLPRTTPIESTGQASTAGIASFLDNEQRTTLKLDPKLYPLSQATWLGGLNNFKVDLGDLQGVFVENGAGLISGGTERDRKGKGKEGSFSDGRSGRGAHAQRKKSRRSRTTGLSLGGDTDAHRSEDDMRGGTSGRLPSPGPPRKRPRDESHRERSSSVDSEIGMVGYRAAGGESGMGGGGTMGTLPSPNLSPPSPVASIVAMDDDEVEPVATINDSAIDIDQEAPPTLEQNYDFGSGQALSGLLSLPDFVNTFDQLTPALQSYFIFTFLKRSPIPVLQTLNNIIAPSLRRDFLTDLPPELGVHILGYLDARALCRATRVCARWRRLVDGEWRVWKERLTGDELWIGDGTEAREAREITEGSKENVFLKRWNAGVWDEPNSSRRIAKAIEAKRESDSMQLDPADRLASRNLSRTANLASPSSSRESSPLPSGHYVHPFKALYRRRFVIRRNWAEREPERVTFACHANNVVTCLQFDKDKIVSASDDHSINVFDTRTGATKARLDGHEGGVWALQYIGNILVSGSTDRTVRVWDLEKGVCTHIFVGHTSTVRCLQIVEPENIQTDPRGEPIWEPPYPLIVTGSRDWSLRVWKLPSPDRDNHYHPVVPMSPTEENTDPSENPFHLRHLAGHRHAVRALAAHGKTLVSGSYDCTVRVWNMLTGECKHRLAGHTQKVYSVVYDHQRQQCASGSMDGTVRLWSTESGECKATLEGHSSLVGLLGLSHRAIVSAAADSTLRIWNPTTGECQHTLTAHSGAITCFQHDEYKVISGSDGTLKMWDAQNGTFTRDLLTGLTGVWQVSFDKRFCVAAVQRNGRSEFEILDFGPVDWEDEVEREVEKRVVEVGEEDQEVESTIALPQPTPTAPNVTPRVVRRTTSLRNLPAIALASSSLSSYRARISAAVVDTSHRATASLPSNSIAAIVPLVVVDQDRDRGEEEEDNVNHFLDPFAAGPSSRRRRDEVPSEVIEGMDLEDDSVVVDEETSGEI